MLLLVKVNPLLVTALAAMAAILVALVIVAVVGAGR
jgi:hypothetical protein